MNPTSLTPPATKPQRPLLTDSQLTDQDRRQVRNMERQLLRSLKGSASELIHLESDMFSCAALELDEMYEHVCYPREGNLDGQCLDELDATVVKQSDMLGSTDMTKFKFSDLITASCAVCVDGSGEFQWGMLGDAIGSCFRSVPDINLVFGLIDTKVADKTKKKPPRRVFKDVNAQEAQPHECTAKSNDIKGAQVRRLEILETAVAREPEQKVPLFDVVLDSSSFEQTVENLFDTSFLVHRGSLAIGPDDSTELPLLELKPGTGDMPQSDQSIINITPSQWEELVNAYGRDEPLVGHRS